MAEPPGHAYFHPKHGRWTGAYRFTCNSLRDLFSGTMGVSDKLTFASLGVFCRLFGPLRIETLVDASKLDEGTVYHTTRISKWSVSLMWSEEWFTFAADGRSFTVTGGVHTAPFGWVERPYRNSRGEIDEGGERASYDFSWASSRIRQRSSPGTDGLEVVQELDGCGATFVLRPLR